jgi:hypothetical protein
VQNLLTLTDRASEIEVMAAALPRVATIETGSMRILVSVPFVKVAADLFHPPSVAPAIGSAGRGLTGKPLCSLS